MPNHFWRGFTKAAEILTDLSDPDTQSPTMPRELERTVSSAGPRLADLTEESDRGKLTSAAGAGS